MQALGRDEGETQSQEQGALFQQAKQVAEQAAAEVARFDQNKQLQRQAVAGSSRSS